jgi:hypothetical protein
MKKPIELKGSEWRATPVPSSLEQKRKLPELKGSEWRATPVPSSLEQKRKLPELKGTEWRATPVPSSLEQKRKLPEMKGTEWRVTSVPSSLEQKRKLPELKGSEWRATPAPSSLEQKRKPSELKSSSWSALPSEHSKPIDRMDNPKIKISPSPWGNISGLQAPKVIRTFDGLNELTSFAIKDTHATQNKNVTSDAYPTLSVRSAFTTLPGGDLGIYDNPIEGIMVHSNKELHAIYNGEWHVYRTSPTPGWTLIKQSLFAPNPNYSFINFTGNFANPVLIAVSGNANGAPLKYDGTTVSNLANAPTGATCIATHDNRVYLAKGQTVYFSALRKAEDWSTVNDSGQIVVETADGKPITGLVAGSARLTVFKENTIHELFGTNPTNFQMKLISENIGSPTGQTAQVIDGVIYFLGNDGVYRYSGGSMPNSDFSIAVKQTLSTINYDSAKYAVSWTIGKKYYLAVPTGYNDFPDTILEYDTLYNTWNEWYTPFRFATPGVIFNGEICIGTNTGSVQKYNTKDLTKTKDTLVNVHGNSSYDINYEWVTKPFTYASLAGESSWFKLWITADIPNGSTMNVSLSTEEKGTNFTLVKTVNGIFDGSGTQPTQILIPLNNFHHAHWIRLKLDGIGPVTIHEITRQERTLPFGM